MLYEMKHQRLEFSAEFEGEIRKKKQKIDWEMEDARMELTSILKQQEAEKEQTDKDDVDGVEADDRK